mgnify:CR=1 FL=1|jgi:hypothetical protein
MKQGKALEQLVASLEKALSVEQSVLIKSPKRMPDKTTGRLREHDVVLTINQAHHTFLIAIECRDLSRPVTVNQVEGFWAKCQHTGVGQGVMVSASGFYNSARTKADHLGIRCLDLEEAKSFNWLLAPGIQATTRRLLRNDWTFFPEKEGVVEAGNFEVIDGKGNVATMASLTANAQTQLTKLLPETVEPVDEAEMVVKFPGTGLLLRNLATGETVPVKVAVARIQYSVTIEMIPFRLVQYKEEGKDRIITDAAYADLSIGDRTARLVITHKENEGGRVVIVPQPKGDG